MSNINIVTINSSPKEGGQTERILGIFVKAAKRLGLQVKEVRLYNEDIKPVDGRLDKKLGNLDPLQKILIEADGFVIATPTYWFNMPGILKNFVDGLTILEENNWLLENKVVGLIVYAPQGGEMGVLTPLALTFNHMGIVIPPYGLIYYRGELDNYLLEDIKLLATSMKRQINAQKKLNFKPL